VKRPNRNVLLTRAAHTVHRAYLDPARAVGKANVVGEHVGVRHLLADGRLGKQLVLPDAEREYVALKLLRG